MSRSAIVLPPRPELYQRAMTALVQKALPFSPLVEKSRGDGHLFIDITGTERLFGPPQDTAQKIRRATVDTLRLDPIWTLAGNKLTAKAASRTVKPYGECIVEPGDEAEFLRPLPLHLLPGLGWKELKTFRELNITRVEQAARLTEAQLFVLMDKRTKSVYEALHGIDFSPVLPAGADNASVKAMHIFGSDTNNRQELEAVLYMLADRTGAELRQRKLGARRFSLYIAFSDGVRALRNGYSPNPLSSANDIFTLSLVPLSATLARRVRVRLMSLTCDKLKTPNTQLNLFAVAEKESPYGKLDTAFDAIRKKYGRNAIRTGRELVTL